MAWEENSCICLNMQLIAILSRIGVTIAFLFCNLGKSRYINTLPKMSILCNFSHQTTVS